MRRTILAAFASASLAAAAVWALAGEPQQGEPKRDPPPRGVSGVKPPAVFPGRYAGEPTCRRCHYRASQTWKDTPHAKAFEVLPPKYREDASCLPCHATGFGQPGGFVSAAQTGGLGGVQCEMCHGPGASHAELAQANEKKLDDPAVIRDLKAGHIAHETTCVRCHRGQAHGKHPEYEKPAAKEPGPKDPGPREPPPKEPDPKEPPPASPPGSK